MNKHIGKVAVDRNYRKRRYRQIGRLIHYYCRVRLMECNKDGRWVTADEFWKEYFDELRESEA